MIVKESILTWLEEWYAAECNGDWEHSYGVQIQSLDNPGWAVRIDLRGTYLEGISIEQERREAAEEDWYVISVREAQFQGYGDPSKAVLAA